MFAPNDETDPEFGNVLREAAVKGMEMYAYPSGFTGDRITLKEKVEVELGYGTH